MKASAFGYRRPASLGEAAAVLNSNAGAKIIAGGQTLGPMLNLRLARPALLIDITRIPEMTQVAEASHSVTYGACITHANFEDGRVPDPTGGFLVRVARGIAYRAVRNRGTIGGSLAHADPAADWLSALSALDVEIGISGPARQRSVVLGHFIKGALSTGLSHGEMIASVSVKRPPAGTRFGYSKICRKTGEFAEAIGAVSRDPAAAKVRLVAGATGKAPIVIENGAEFIAGRQVNAERLADHLVAKGLEDDPYQLALHTAVLQRALDDSWTA